MVGKLVRTEGHLRRNKNKQFVKTKVVSQGGRVAAKESTSSNRGGFNLMKNSLIIRAIK
jgi:hypothetical protein